MNLLINIPTSYKMSLGPEIDMLTFENKLRSMVQDLIAPTIRRTIESHQIVEAVEKHDYKNAERLDTLEFNVTRLLSRVPLLDDVHKHVLELQIDKQSSEGLLNVKFESMMGHLNQNNHEIENLMSLIKVNEDSIAALKNDLVQYTESLNGLKNEMLEDNSLVSKKLEKTRMQGREMWDLLTGQIKKAEAMIENFNITALPKINAEVEMVKRRIEDERTEFLQRIENFISFEEFDKFGRSLKFELDKTHQNFKILTENSDKIEEYLDHYLPVETWGMISEAMSYLQPKVLANFIEFDQKQYDTLKLDFDFDFLDIDGLSKRALDSFDEAEKRRETLKAAIIEELKKEQKIAQKLEKSSKNERQHTKRGSELSRRASEIPKRPSDFSKRPSESPKKISQPVIKLPEPLPTVSEISNKIAEIKSNEPSDKPMSTYEKIMNFEKPQKKDSVESELTAAIQGKLKESAALKAKLPELPVIKEELPQDLDRSPTDLRDRENSLNADYTKTQTLQGKLKSRPGSSRRSILELDPESSSLYIPMPSRPSSRNNNTVAISPQIVESDYNSDSQNQSIAPSPTPSNGSYLTPESSPGVDPAKLENDLEIIRNTIATLEARSKITEEIVENSTRTLGVTLDKFSQDLTSNFALMHGEIKLLLQKNKQNKGDVSKTLKAFQAELKERDKVVERVDGKFGNVSELVGYLVEFCRVVHLILSQEEEDRENLNLIGFSDNTSKGNPKGYLSLKSECMSCTGNSTVVMTAFKMACINYNPSPVRYNSRTFTRKQLISLMGSFINESWRSASAKPPYDIIPPPTISSQALTSDTQQNRRNRYCKSQYFELPSLNTSKQFLDINDSIHSYREFKQ